MLYKNIIKKSVYVLYIMYYSGPKNEAILFTSIYGTICVSYS